MNTATTTNTQTQRRQEAFHLCTTDRTAAADFYPGDATFIEAWTATRQAAAHDRGAAPTIIDNFLRGHLDELRDLARRARFGRGPGPVLDDIARTLAAIG